MHNIFAMQEIVQYYLRRVIYICPIFSLFKNKSTILAQRFAILKYFLYIYTMPLLAGKLKPETMNIRTELDREFSGDHYLELLASAEENEFLDDYYSSIEFLDEEDDAEEIAKLGNLPYIEYENGVKVFLNTEAYPKNKLTDIARSVLVSALDQDAEMLENYQLIDNIEKKIMQAWADWSDDLTSSHWEGNSKPEHHTAGFIESWLENQDWDADDYCTDALNHELEAEA
jgi:hypothetical protein